MGSSKMAQQNDITAEPTKPPPKANNSEDRPCGPYQPSSVKAVERPWCLLSEEWVKSYVPRPPPEILEPRATETEYAAATKQPFQVAGLPPSTPRAEWKCLEKARDCVAHYRACQARRADAAASSPSQATLSPHPPASPPRSMRLRPRRSPHHMPVDPPMASVATLLYLRPKKRPWKGQ